MKLPALLALDHDARITFKVQGEVNVEVEPIEVPPSESEIVASVSVTLDGITVTLTGGHMAYTLPSGKMVTLKISYKDAKGNPAKIDGLVQWESTDPRVISIHPVEPTAENPNADKSLALAVTEQVIGTVQIKARADADLGEGVKELITLLDMEHVAGEAVTGTIEPVGPPVDQMPVNPQGARRRP